MKRLALLLLICLAAVYPASSATFTVNSTVDKVDIAEGDGVCRTEAGTCTLRAAVQEANASPATTDTIIVPAGTYMLTLDTGLHCHSSCYGGLGLGSSMLIRGAGITKTFIERRRSLEAVEHGVIDVAAGKVVQLRELTVRKGRDQDYGGCITNAGQLALNTVIVTGCEVEDEVNGTFGFGAAIANYGKLTIQGSQITNNKMTAGETSLGTGGAIYNHTGARLTMARTLVSGNTMMVHPGRSGPGSGAGVFNRGYLEVTDSTFKDNSAHIDGGAIVNSGGTAKLVKSTFSVNESRGSGSGGALFNQDEGGRQAVMTLVNCTISGNISGNNGGGINTTRGGDLFVQNSTITGNRAGGTGGGIYNDSLGTASLQNSIVAGNAATRSAPDCTKLKIANYSLIGRTSGCTIPAGTGNMLNVDPLLGSLANNGGTTQTHALLTGSAAIDFGSPAIPGSGGKACEKTDKRGVARPQNGRCDMGSYERRPGTP